ncbi:MAG: hypothetical protein AMXMBFR47_27000 [Planctomycetota bacterium]
MRPRVPRCLCGAVLLLLAGTPATGQDRFRYALPRGECWTYERKLDISRDGAAVHSGRQTIRIWFLDTRTEDADAWIEIAPAGDERGILYAGPVTIDRSGRRRSPPEFADRLPELDAALEILPGLAPALGPADRWDSGSDANGRALQQSLSDGTGEGDIRRVRYDVIDREGVDAFLGRRASGEYIWDVAAGRVREVVERQRVAGLSLETEVRCRFLASAPLGEAWCGRRRQEIVRYLAAVRAEAGWISRSGREALSPETLLSNLDRVWVEFLHVEPREEDSPVRRAAESRRRELRARAETLRERARQAAQWVGTHAAAWSLLAPDGTAVKSESLGKGGLVEVFWSARSVSSLRSMATIRAALAAATARDIAIVCINLDTDVNLARRAIDACGGGLTHVLSGPPIGGDSPSDLPVIRFLDADRRVVRVLFGRQVNLQAELSEAFGR